MKNLVVALENVRSLENIGAIIRTCSFFNIKKIILIGYSGKFKTPGGFEYLNPKILKSSLGAEKDLELIFIDNTKKLVEYSQELKLKIYAVEQSLGSKDISTVKGVNNAILVFGNEVSGVSADTLNISDKILEIKRLGKHNSLNVATTVGITLFHFTK